MWTETRYTHFMPLTEWINSEMKQFLQAYYEDDTGNTFNPFIKFAMCMLVDNGNTKNLLVSLPQDVEALVLLFSGDNKNVSSERLSCSLTLRMWSFFLYT